MRAIHPSGRILDLDILSASRRAVANGIIVTEAFLTIWHQRNDLLIRGKAASSEDLVRRLYYRPHGRILADGIRQG